VLGRLAGYAKGVHTLVSQEIKPKGSARETSKRNSQEKQPRETAKRNSQEKQPRERVKRAGWKNREGPAMKSSQRRTVKKNRKNKAARETWPEMPAQTRVKKAPASGGIKRA
jgi:hypothetical protein